MSRSEPDWPRAVGVEVVQDLSRISPPTDGYLRRYRHCVKTRLGDGTRTDAYVVDYIDRAPDKRDAAAIAIYAPSPSGRVQDTILLLRRQVRYAAFVVAGRPLTTEVHAGLIEGGESARACAVREAWEEAGVRITEDQVLSLGRPFFPLPGIFTERIVPLAVELSLEALETARGAAPPGDGSAFEEGADAVVMTLGEAFALMEAPEPTRPTELTLDDAKTEIVLARLWRHLDER